MHDHAPMLDHAFMLTAMHALTNLTATLCCYSITPRCLCCTPLCIHALDILTECCLQGDQAAQCQALSEYTLYSIPTTKAKASRGSVNFAIDLSAPAFSVQSEVCAGNRVA